MILKRYLPPQSSLDLCVLVRHFTGFFLVVLSLQAIGCGTAGDAVQTEPPNHRTLTNSEPEASNPFSLTDVAKDWHVEFSDMPANPGEYRLAAVMGSGCGVFDANQDDRLDILLLASNSEGGRNAAIFLQEESGVFRDVSADFGVESMSGTGVAVADCNNDGWPDIYTTSTGLDSLWLNIQGKKFRRAANAIPENQRWSTAACWLDFDRDGWLDLFVTNYVDYVHRPCSRLAGGGRDFCRPSLFDRTTDRLFRNVTSSSDDGNVEFEDVSAQMGILDGQSAGLGVTAFDSNSDGWPDIYVASDQHPNLLWVNNQGKSFSERAPASGLDLDYAGRAQASMGIALASVGPGKAEGLVVSHLENEANAVYSPIANGLFADISRESGMGTLTRPLTGFGLAEIDFRLDGVPEILMVSGQVRRPGNAVDGDSPRFWADYQQPLQITRVSNEQTSKGNRAAVHSSAQFVGRGLATGDLDGDGDCDAVVSTVGQPAVLLRNDSDRQGRCLWFRPVDPELGGRSCPGTVLDFLINRVEHSRTFQPCQSYASTHADSIGITYPSDVKDFTVIVHWPHGVREPEQFDLNVSGHHVELQRGNGTILK